MELDDTACSFNEWKSAGYFVRRGEKSQMRDMLGVPQFTADQVCQCGQTITHWNHLQKKLMCGPKARGAVGSGRTQTHWEESAGRAEAKGTPWGVVEDFDSFVREAGMLPDLSRRTRFAISSPLEMHFMNVADKHGILDGILDGDEDDWY